MIKVKHFRHPNFSKWTIRIYLDLLLFSIVDCCWMQFFCCEPGCEIFCMWIKKKEKKQKKKIMFKGVLSIVSDVTRRRFSPKVKIIQVENPFSFIFYLPEGKPEISSHNFHFHFLRLFHISTYLLFVTKLKRWYFFGWKKWKLFVDENQGERRQMMMFLYGVFCEYA